MRNFRAFSRPWPEHHSVNIDVRHIPGGGAAQTVAGIVCRAAGGVEQLLAETTSKAKKPSSFWMPNCTAVQTRVEIFKRLSYKGERLPVLPVASFPIRLGCFTGLQCVVRCHCLSAALALGPPLPSDRPSVPTHHCGLTSCAGPILVSNWNGMSVDCNVD